MNRRHFFRTAAAVTAALPNPTNLFAGEASWRTFQVTTQVHLVQASGPARVWVPAALIRNTPFQRTLSNRFHCEAGTARLIEPNLSEALGLVAAEFPSAAQAQLTVTSRVALRNWSVPLEAPRTHHLTPADRKLYLHSTTLIPTDGIVQQTAAKITAHSQTDEAKARAIYEWIVENTSRNPKTRGCGRGNIRFMLESGDLSGKCADINALFVGLCRAAGLPARDVYGIRVAPSQLGFNSLGTHSQDITKSQHCRAEVYLAAYGWVPVDPADVRKVMLEEPPGHRSATDPLVEKARNRLFGAWEMNWMAYNFASDIDLPGAAGSPLPFLLYPQAEVSGQRLDCLNPATFSYQITAQELTV